MAVVTNVEYCGKDAQEMYVAAILGGETTSKVRQFVNVKNSLKVRNLDGNDDILQEMDCDFAPNEDLSLTEKEITTCDFKINLEICVTDWVNTYVSDSLRPGHNTGEVTPEALTRYIVERTMEKVKGNIEQYYWNGDTASSLYPLCNGMIKGLEADATVIDINAVVINSSNVFAELTRVYNAIPEAIKFKQDGSGNFAVKFFASANVIASYKLYQASIGYGNVFAGAGDKPLNFMGYDLIYTPGLRGSNIVAADPNNLWLATDLISDFQDIKTINMYDILGTPTMRMVGGFKFGVGHGVGAEIVLYN